jgi:hypothetical protein
MEWESHQIIFITLPCSVIIFLLTYCFFCQKKIEAQIKKDLTLIEEVELKNKQGE